MISSSKFAAGLRKAGSVPPYVVLSGIDEFLVAECFEAVDACLGSEADVLTFDWNETGDDSRLLELFDELRTASLFGSAKVVRVRGARAFLIENSDALCNFTEQDEPVGTLVLEDADLVAKGAAKSITAALKAVDGAGGVIVDCAPPRAKVQGYGRSWWDSDLTRWVVDRFDAAGKSIAPEVAHVLHSAEGGGLRALAAQIEKLVTHVGERPEVASADVERLVGDTRQTTAFELVDRVAARDLQGALATSRRLFEAGMSERGKVVRDPTELTMRSIALMAHRVRELGRIIEARRGGASYEEAAVSVLGPHRKWLVKRYRGQLEANSPRELGDLLMALEETDEALKTSVAEPRVLLETVIARHCRRTPGIPA